MTPERKEILLENLRKGRAKYKQKALEKKEQLNRNNNEEVNSVKPDNTEPHKEIKYNPKADIDELKETLKELKEMLNKTKTEQKIEAKIESIINKNIIEEKPILQQEKQQPILQPTPPIPIPPKKVIYSLFKTANW
jgi:hypothetical protein